MALSLLAASLILFGVGAGATIQLNRAADAPTARGRWTKYWTYFLICHAMGIAILLGPLVFAALVAALVIVGAAELLSVDTRKGGNTKSLLSRAAIYLGFGWLAFGILRFALDISTEKAVFVYLLVAAMDGFSQVSGQLFGKHQLAPTISPNKTVEGALGGGLATVLIGGGLCWLVGTSAMTAATWALGIALAALAGDLAASWTKRFHEVKDFGRHLPGHGGILDCFDSFIMAGSAYWALQQFGLS